MAHGFGLINYVKAGGLSEGILSIVRGFSH